MGGTVAITIRLKDGTEHRMSRWTNSIPIIVHDPEFLNGGAQLQEYIKKWENYVETYEATKIGMSFVEPQNPYLAPNQYGLIVVDFQSNIIVDAQDYCGIGREYFLLSSPAKPDGPFNIIVQVGDEQEALYKALFEKERVEKFSYGVRSGEEPVSLWSRFLNLFRRKGDSVTQETGKLVIEHEIREFFPSRWRKDPEKYKMFLKKLKEEYYDHDHKKIDRTPIQLHVDMSPFKVITYDCRERKQMTSLKTLISRLGFELSEAEEEIWEKWEK